MTYHRVAFLSKLPSLSRREFIDYYENKHIPLIVSLSGDTLPFIYKRRYVEHECEPARKAADDGMPFDYDVITELVFHHEDGFNAWAQQISKDGGAEKIAKDEARFLDRSRTRSTNVEEFVTRG